jgi:hypothetical protein
VLKKILLPVLVLSVSVAFCLVAAEVVVRIARPQPRLVITPGGFYMPDPPGRYRLSPGYRGRIYNRAEYDNIIRINQQGLRGEELTPKPQNGLRVLTIGDSFVFGVGVEDTETFTARLSSLAAQSGSQVQGLNAGIPAFGVPDAESWMRRHGVGLEPDVVIMAVFLGNDLVDASPDREEILLVDGLLKPGQSAGGIKAWLFRHSHLYVAVKGLLEQPALMPLRSLLGLGEPWKLRTLREEFGVYKTSAEGDLAPAIEATDAALGRLVDLAEQQGFRLVSVLIPSEIQVDPERWQAGMVSLDLEPEKYDPQTPTRIFKALLERHRIPTLDLGPCFAEGLARGEDLYFRLDRHWTVAGHNLAAEQLSTFLAATLAAAAN